MSTPFDPQSVAAFSDEVARKTGASASTDSASPRHRAARRFVRRVSQWIARTNRVAGAYPGRRGASEAVSLSFRHAMPPVPHGHGARKLGRSLLTSVPFY